MVLDKDAQSGESPLTDSVVLSGEWDLATWIFSEPLGVFSEH
jgi:hypothetical protein